MKEFKLKYHQIMKNTTYDIGRKGVENKKEIIISLIIPRNAP